MNRITPILVLLVAAATALAQTFPDISSRVVTETGTQTLTNKALTNPTINGGFTLPTVHTAAGYSFRTYNGGGQNDVLAFGYNVAPTGGRIMSNELQLYQGFESSWLNGGLGAQTLEWYIRFVQSDGATMHEPFFAGYNRTTNRIFQSNVRGDVVQFENSLGASPYMSLQSAGATLYLPLTLSGVGITATGAASTFAAVTGTTGNFSSTTEATGAALVGALTTPGGIWAGKNVVAGGAHLRYKSVNGSGGGQEDQIAGWINTNGTLGTAGLYGVNTLLDNSSVWLRFKTINAAGSTQHGMDLSPAGNLLIGGTTDIAGTGGLKVFGTTQSTSSSTGALVVGGGVGVGGNANVGGNLAVVGGQNVLGVSSSAVTLTTNATMTFELTSNTQLTIKVRGGDGTTRGVTLTLAP